MSAWLVDTHALLWFLTDDAALSPTAKGTMESHDDVLLVSAASLWEIAIKTSLGKLDAPDDLPALIRDEGFECLTVTDAHAWAVRQLPLAGHKDPFDRLLAAQAQVEQLAIVSNDERLDRYGVTRRW